MVNQILTVDRIAEQKNSDAVSNPLTIGEPMREAEIEQICRTGGQPGMEFRCAPDGSIQRRDLRPDGGVTTWQGLSRSEVIHYLNYGGVVGVWLNGLVDQGLIRVRRQPRSRVLFPFVLGKYEWTNSESMYLGLGS
jgi:hypothetical protein